MSLNLLLMASRRLAAVIPDPEPPVDPPVSIDFVNGWAPADHSGGTPVASIALPAQDHTTGNSIVVAVRSANVAGGTPVGVSSVTDTAGNTYSRAGAAEVNDTIATTEVWLASGITGHAANIVSVEFESDTQYARAMVAQYSSAIEYSASVALHIDGAWSTSRSGGTVTTVAADEIVFGGVFSYDGDSGALTGASGTTVQAYATTGTGTSSGIADMAAATAGDYALTINSASACGLLIITRSFKAASGGGGSYVYAASRSAADVQAAINSASSGQIVVLPAGGSATWDVAVSIPDTKGVTLDGNGATITRGSLSDGDALISASVNPSVVTRITGFSFTDAKSSIGYFISVSNGTEASAKFRIDHCDFMGINVLTHILITSPIYGLIDNNTFTWSGNNEVIHNEAYGAASSVGWTNDVSPGSDQALYIEDNTFINNTSGDPAYFWGGSAVQGYYGARTVFRHNYLEMAAVDMHGTAGMIGARWWEVYENTFYVVPNGDMDKAIGMRAGSGVIFNNKKIGRTDYKADFVLYEEDSGYPALYQIGRGKNQALDPAYIWGNDSTMPTGSGSANVQADRDYYCGNDSGGNPITFTGAAGTGFGLLSARPSSGLTVGVGYWATDTQTLYVATGAATWAVKYQPYTYPHPLRA